MNNKIKRIYEKKNSSARNADLNSGIKGKKIAQNTIWLIISKIIANIVSLFAVGFIANKLGVAGYGELEGAMAFAAIFSPIVFAGIQIILIREVVARPMIGPRAIGDAIVIRMAMAIIYGLLVILLHPFLVSEISITIIAISICYFIIMNMLQSITIAFESSEKMHYMAIGEVITTFSGTAFCILAVLMNYGPAGVMTGRVMGIVSQAVFLIFILFYLFYKPTFEINFKRYYRIIKRGLPLALSFLVGLLLLRIDQTMLMAMKGKSEVGLYSCATELAYKFEMIVIAFQTALVPGLVASYRNGLESYRTILLKSLRVMLILALPVAVGTRYVSKEIVLFIFKADYLSSADVLTVIIWFVPFQFLNRILASSIAIRGRENIVFYGALIALIANVTLNFILIPTFGMFGAGCATVITEILLTIIYTYFQKQFIFEGFGNLKIIQVIAATLVMNIVCFLFKGQHVLVIIFVAIIMYTVSAFALGCISREEIKQIVL